MLKKYILVFSLLFISIGAYANVSSVTYVDQQVETVNKNLDEYKTANDKVVAAKANGDDPKFNTISTSKPSGQVPEGYAHIWIE